MRPRRSPWRGEAQEGSAQLEVALPSSPVTWFGAGGKHVGHVVIGMDPHKRPATIESIDGRGQVLFQGRFGTDRDGYRAMLAAGRKFPDRVRAVEGCNGIGRHLAQRLVADGEPVAGVPAKLSARARLLSTGQGRETDPAGAHSVALAGVHSPGLRVIAADDATVALRLLADRRDGLGAARTQTINRLHRLLLELLPGGAEKFLSAAQAKDLLATVGPRGIAGKTRRRLAAELVTELTRTGKRIKTAGAELKELVTATGSSLLTLHGIGPSGAARLLGDVGDIARFADKGRFASWNGTAPWMPPAVTRTGTACPGQATAGSTGSCTSWLSSRCATTPKAAPTTGAGSPPAKPPWKRCGASNGGCRHRLPADDQRRPQGRGNGPGRTHGDGYWLQRGRL
jgi:transposase